jgi:hypothetical protein
MRVKKVLFAAWPGVCAQAIVALLVFTAVPARVALAQPAPSAAPIALPEATPQDAEPLPGPPPAPLPPPPPNVEVPAGLKGRLVVITTAAGRTEGLLKSIDDDELVVENYSQQLVTIARSSVVAARLLNPPHEAAEATWAHPGEPLEGPAVPPPSPWGYWGSISLGPVWGQRSGSATPAGMFAFDFGLSYHFVYVGVGFGLTWFDGAGSFSNETTGGTLSSGGPVSGEGHAEIGLTHGIFFPTSDTESIELRPGVGIGAMAMSSASQGIDHCIDCDSRTYDYNSAPYVRFQLGVYRSIHPEGSLVHRVFMSQNGVFFGGTASFQEFFAGPSPRLEHALLFAFTVGKGP